MPNINKIILGIDPGTNLLGYALIKVCRKVPEIITLGVIDMRKCKDVHEKLGRIYERITNLIETFHPNELAIEAPFCGKNPQSMLKLGRAQGVAIAAAIAKGMIVSEYAPTKIKIAITGSGSASKEQVSSMLQHIFNLNPEKIVPYLDATDALAAAYCHLLQGNSPIKETKYSGWADYIAKNSNKVVKPKTSKN